MNLLGVFSFVTKAIGGVTITRRFSWTGYLKGNAMPPNQRYAYFTDLEVLGLAPEFVSKLDLARKVAEIPFIITSGFRTPEKNQSVVGAVADSAHLKGLAVDLAVSDSHAVFKIIEGAMSSGIGRIGIYIDQNFTPTHVHLDVDPEKVQEVIFIKQEGISNVKSA